MRVLFGTSNPAKLDSMRERCKGLDMEIIGLGDMGFHVPEPDENGNDPLENAQIKAFAYYEAFNLPVFSADSGLYIDGLTDERQPGVHVRNINGRRLSDDEMIKHYSQLADEFGGKMTARYRNAICFVINRDNVFAYMGEDIASHKFFITSKPHHKLTSGYPLDSLSVHIESGKYYNDLYNLYRNDVLMDKGFRNFFEDCLKNVRIN